MATLTQYPPSGCVVQPRSAARGWSARFRAWRTRRRDYARTMAALSELDARDLRDLAVSRYDFDAIARGTYRR